MLKLKVSIGCNKKVGSDTAILNICSATDCPARKLGFCQVNGHKHCYAMRAERLYPSVLKHRKKQEEIWQKITVKDAIKTLEQLQQKLHKDIYNNNKKKLKFLRFSEAGDFRNQEDVDNLSRIAEGLKGQLIVYGYTARKDLDFSEVSDNLIINGSGFMVHNEFKAVDTVPQGAPFVCGGNCRECDLCKERRGIQILVKMH